MNAGWQAGDLLGDWTSLYKEHGATRFKDSSRVCSEVGGKSSMRCTMLYLLAFGPISGHWRVDMGGCGGRQQSRCCARPWCPDIGNQNAEITVRFTTEGSYWHLSALLRSKLCKPEWLRLLYTELCGTPLHRAGRTAELEQRLCLNK